MVTISNLSKKRRQVITEILENWETAELVEIREFDNNEIQIVFRIPDNDDAYGFIKMTVDVRMNIYKRHSDMDKVNIRLTA
jgi:hypothetical protein